MIKSSTRSGETYLLRLHSDSDPAVFLCCGPRPEGCDFLFVVIVDVASNQIQESLYHTWSAKATMWCAAYGCCPHLKGLFRVVSLVITMKIANETGLTTPSFVGCFITVMPKSNSVVETVEGLYHYIADVFPSAVVSVRRLWVRASPFHTHSLFRTGQTGLAGDWV